MKKSKYSDSQSVAILKEAEAGWPVKESCRKYKISPACYYNWKSKFGGMSVSEPKRTRELEAENAKLKRMYADLALENHALKDLIEKSSEAARETCGRRVSDRDAQSIDSQGLPSDRPLEGGVVPAAGGLAGAPPTDSADECYMGHDICWGNCDNGSCNDDNLAACMNECDLILLRCLRNLDSDPRKWPIPARVGTEGDTKQFMFEAKVFFGSRVLFYDRRK
jgi:putative transposase